MLIFIPLRLHLSLMLTLEILLITPSVMAEQLDMAEDSVDDMYNGCRNAMGIILNQTFYKERSHAGWKTSNSCAEQKLQERQTEDMALTKDHLQAICMYTGYVGYREINRIIKEKRNEYGSGFQFHTLYFYLTSAIQILNSNHHCLTSYRRTRDNIEGKVNQRFRFGFFASSSILSDLSQFGAETCFKIKTCLGAYLKHYPKRGTDEEEVLIPPYETFTIKNVIKKPKTVEGLEDCKVVYVVEHQGGKSNLNCKVFKQYQDSGRGQG